MDQLCSNIFKVSEGEMAFRKFTEIFRENHSSFKDTLIKHKFFIKTINEYWGKYVVDGIEKEEQKYILETLFDNFMTNVFLDCNEYGFDDYKNNLSYNNSMTLLFNHNPFGNNGYF
ncbi:hypothetical protein DICPUDRAFT_77175 [Dictyostelium purpureum]|uniref:Uncharacterized protein n=1 Tax=Dictyostelium purpureum TaxID=5786 RepID=F0ZFU3_DICPU|nr:uncharacterized protein DICPUDRAFT_77175 [Dictyostelium purpureum]EGC37171.1 hypothetical protein DICPUDRAFT_77175 [Dictyostelium purpureum]|eukprot:XP_003286299.1 hypothetical protein DICPUDRAFT_77175 [Dictyostelium purpureum]